MESEKQIEKSIDDQINELEIDLLDLDTQHEGGGSMVKLNQEIKEKQQLLALLKNKRAEAGLNDVQRKRKGGSFHWVHFCGSKIAAIWNSNDYCWSIPGSDKRYHDEDFDNRINEREIPEPTDETIDVIANLIRNKFDKSASKENVPENTFALKLIAAAREIGMEELASEMEKDMI